MRTFRVPRGGVTALAYLPDGRLVSGDNAGLVALWTPHTGTREDLMLCRYSYPDGGTYTLGVDQLIPSDSGRLLVCDFPIYRTLYDLTERRAGEWPTSFDAISRPHTFLNGSHTLAGRGLGGNGKPRDAIFFADPECAEATFGACPDVWVWEVSPHDRTLIVGAPASNHRTLVAWDPDAGREMTRFAEHPSNVEKVAISKNGQRLAVAGGRTARVYDVTTGRTQAEVKASARAGVRSLARIQLTPSGRYLVMAGAGPAVVVWDVDADRPRATFDTGFKAVNVLAVDPDDLTLAAGGTNREFVVIDLD